MADRSALPTDRADDIRGSRPPMADDVPADERQATTAADTDTDLPADSDTPGDVGGARRGPLTTVPRSARSLVWQSRIGMGVGILGLILAAVLFLQNQDLRRDAADAAEVLEAGEITALRVTTFDGATIDQWVADTQSIATGDYADEVATLFDTEIRQGLADNQVQSVGEITRSFVQEVDRDDATVFVVIRQTFTSVNQQQPISDELRMEIELDRVDGRWLASGVAVLGPSTVSPVTEGDPTAGEQPLPVPTEEGP